MIDKTGEKEKNGKQASPEFHLCGLKSVQLLKVITQIL